MKKGFAINDEFYTELLEFSGETDDEIINYAINYAGFKDYEVLKESKEDSLWVSISDKESESFVIIQIFDIDCKSAVVHWHAYDGVDFKVYPDGDLKALVAKKKDELGDNFNIDVEQYDFVCLDIYGEWLMWRKLSF